MFEAVGWLVGAILGGIFGYAFARYQKRQEGNATREVLLAALFIEVKIFQLIYEETHSYKEDSFYYRSPIRMIVPMQLLNSGVLDFRKEGGLVASLITLQTAVAQYNDYVQVTNMAQFTTNLKQESRKQIYENMLLRLQRVLAVRDNLIREMPSDFVKLFEMPMP